MVGAVVVGRKDELLGEGYHQRVGGPHAEVHALEAAGAGARGATLYVSLEPCSTAGRTPPCTDAIIRAGIGRVVIACPDPNPKHAGRAVHLLKEKGIDTTIGVCQEAAETLNEAFFVWIRQRRPFVLLKMAMTLDGKIATAGGDSKWVTGEKARRHVQKLRRWADAVLVGGETVRQDDPALTVRTPRNWARQPRKLVWTRTAMSGAELAIFADPGNPPEFIHPASSAQWKAQLAELGRQDVVALLIEGGGELAAACIRAGIVDKVAFFVAPKILGGRDSRPAVGGHSPSVMADALPLTDTCVRRIGDDFLLTGYLNNVYRID